MTLPEMKAADVRALLAYDPETGVFTRKVRTSMRIDVGDVAGTVNRQGYLRISLDNRRYAAHRLAWLYVHGAWPRGVVDHINGNPGDNRIANLRVVSHAVNVQNQRKPRKQNSTGYLGVNRLGDRFCAQISVNWRKRHIGVYATAEEAHAAYVDAKRRLHAGCTL